MDLKFNIHQRHEMASTGQVLPKELRLQPAPTMPQARSYLFKQAATQSSYSEGQTIQINVPRLQRSYLSKESYLKFLFNCDFTANVMTTPAAASAILNPYGSGYLQDLKEMPLFDTPGALGLISKIEVYDYLGSTLLESINGHDALMALLIDMGLDPNQTTSHHSINIGSGGNTIMPDEAILYPKTYTAAKNSWMTQEGPQKGILLHSPHAQPAKTTTGLVTNVGVFPPGYAVCYSADGSESTNGTAITSPQTYYFRKEFAFPLFSFLGQLSNKLVPLHNGFTINLQLNQFARALGYTVNATGAIGTGTFSTANCSVTDVYMCCQVLELGVNAEQMMIESTGGAPLVVSTKSFRNFTGSIPAGASSYKIDLNLNVASLTNVMFIMRESANITTNPLTKRSLSHRIRNFLQNWYFQYGSSILPQTSGIMCRGRAGLPEYLKTDGFTEAYCELVKSRHNWNVPYHNTCMTRRNFAIDVGSDATKLLYRDQFIPRGTFAAGLDLELVPGKSQEIVSGLNTNGMNTSIFMTFDTETGCSPVAANLDVWAEYDAYINISPGIATTVSF